MIEPLLILCRIDAEVIAFGENRGTLSSPFLKTFIVSERFAVIVRDILCDDRHRSVIDLSEYAGQRLQLSAAVP